MPFQSEAQRKYLWLKKPKLAKRWADKYGTPSNLPEKKKKMKGMSVHPVVNCSQSNRKQSIPIDKVL